MVLSVSCCFDLDICSFLTPRGTDLVIAFLLKKLRCAWMTDCDLTGAEASPGKRSEFYFNREKKVNRVAISGSASLLSGPAQCRLNSNSFKNNHLVKHSHSELKHIMALRLNRHTLISFNSLFLRVFRWNLTNPPAHRNQSVDGCACASSMISKKPPLHITKPVA